MWIYKIIFSKSRRKSKVFRHIETIGSSSAAATATATAFPHSGGRWSPSPSALALAFGMPLPGLPAGSPSLSSPPLSCHHYHHHFRQDYYLWGHHYHHNHCHQDYHVQQHYVRLHSGLLELYKQHLAVDERLQWLQVSLELHHHYHLQHCAHLHCWVSQ